MDTAKKIDLNAEAEQFATRFTESVVNAPGLRLSLLRPLLTLLATGEPVTADQLATEASRPVAEIREALAAMPDTEYDAEGRITGFGLTPTPHRYETGGHTFYAWCALDTLGFPAILGHTARVTSPCRATGEPIRLTATPDDQVHFFASADAAKDWLAEHPGARVLPVAEAYDVGRSIIEQIRSGTAETGCC